MANDNEPPRGSKRLSEAAQIRLNSWPTMEEIDRLYPRQARVKGQKSPPRLSIRQRYEKRADEWHKAGRPVDLLETQSLRLIVMICWSHSGGRAYETEKNGPMIDAFTDYLEASRQARAEGDPDWYNRALSERTYCDRCGEKYMLENLSICTDCLYMYCWRCVGDFREKKNGNRHCGCRQDGSRGGELVG